MPPRARALPVAEDVPRTLALGVGLWAFWFLASARAGVFVGMPAEVVAALGVFLAGFAVSAVSVDAGVREWSRRHGRAAGAVALLGLAASSVPAVAALTLGLGAVLDTFAGQAVALFVAPLTAAALVVAARAR